ncbi:ribosome maturation factor RimP [Uliginosibacterium flavum]|uniref:Ribosome maturation factor RimP n=1 Tax=Uliginosibacterium flavum TaxID=1396831 RepID=A0ABV2TGX4_9RHOO
MDLVQLVEQTLSGMGYELVDIEMSPKGRVLRIFMDIERGIVVEDCAAVSNQLTRLFEVEQFEYDRLEVSSPGLDRPLKKAADFERFAGQQAQVRTRLPIGNQRNFAGVLLGMRDGAVILQTEKSEVVLPLDQVEKARLVPKF